MAAERFDIIIIGAGPAGYEAAAHVAAKGGNVLVIERDMAGGTCLNRGCIPTKALCRSAEVMTTVADASAFGINASAPTVDFAAVMSRKDAIVAQLRQGVETLMAKARTEKGEASLRHPVATDEMPDDYAQVVVEVALADGSALTACAPKIMIATGSEPARLPIEGADFCIDSTGMLSLEKLPQSLCIIGGGVIGMEFASIMNAFGVKVSVVEYCKEILPPFDRDIAKRLRTSLKQRGIDFYLQSEVKSVERADNQLRVNFVSKGKDSFIEADVVLMATGRKAVIPKGCDECGIATSRKGITVDSQYQTAVPGVYAVGDCNGICQLAHAATAQALNVVGCSRNCNIIPSAVFTVPECAMVGHTEDSLAEQGIKAKVSKAFYRANGKALAMGEPEGMVKVLTDPDTGRLLGVHILGAHASDLVAEASLAMNTANADAIANTVHAHPTLAELLQAAVG